MAVLPPPPPLRVVLKNGKIANLTPKNVGGRWVYKDSYWIKRYSYLPRFCAISRELIWFKHGYFGFEINTSNHIKRNTWISEKQYMWKLLKEDNDGN